MSQLHWTSPFQEWPDRSVVAMSLILTGNLINDTRPLRDYSKLKHLGLVGISEFPKEVLDLRLKELVLHSNQIKSLPHEIGNMVNLVRLDLSVNMISSLPREIGWLCNLSTLDLSWNRLERLPKEIGQLKKLGYLDLSHNQLVELPKEMDQLSLQVLILEENRLESFPRFCKVLNIRNNPIHQVNAVQLQTLVADQNMGANFFTLDQTELDLVSQSILPFELINSFPRFRPTFENRHKLKYRIIQ